MTYIKDIRRRIHLTGRVMTYLMGIFAICYLGYSLMNGFDKITPTMTKVVFFVVIYYFGFMVIVSLLDLLFERLEKILDTNEKE